MFSSLTAEDAKLLHALVSASKDSIGNAYAEISIILDRYTSVYEKFMEEEITAEEAVEGFVDVMHPFVIRDIRRLLDPRIRAAIESAEPRVMQEVDNTPTFL